MRSLWTKGVLVALTLVVGCSAKDKNQEDASKSSHAAVDCANPNLPQADKDFCDSCNNDNSCVACYQSMDSNSGECQSYCSDPSSMGTMCPSEQKCNDDNGKCDPSKCWCMMDMGSGGSGQGGGSSTSGSGGNGSGAGGDDTSGAGGDTGAGGDDTGAGGDDTGAGGDDSTSSSDASTTDSSGTDDSSGADDSSGSGCDSCFTAPHRAYLRLNHKRSRRHR